MKLTRDNFGELMTPIHRKIFWNAYREKAEQFSDLFKVDAMRQKVESYPHLGGFGMWDSNTEGNDINEDSMSEGPVATFEAERYDKGYSLTWELIKDDLYNVMKGMGKGGSASALGMGLRSTLETQTHNVINNGFSNTGYDGKALFADDHPLVDSTAEGNNLLSGAISDANVKTGLSLIRKHVNEAGLKIQAKADILFGAANIEWDIYTILQSGNVAGTLSNDKNVIPKLRAVISDYLTDGYWGVKDSNFENLMLKWREKPLFDSQFIPKKVDYFMYGYARWDEGYVDWRGICASPGA